MPFLFHETEAKLTAIDAERRLRAGSCGRRPDPSTPDEPPMAELIPAPFGLGMDTAEALLRDLERRLTRGEDLGARRVHIRQISRGLQPLVEALKLSLGHLDPQDAVSAKLIVAGYAMIAIAEHNLEMARPIA